ncbi:hypothetical protein [Nocardiopsis quinghaiensis]|uniref:hypothetical protein n=1 Tax=Nocardiopsis quinghaiensis TaxID=464995 RepID=UPI0037429ED1
MRDTPAPRSAPRPCTAASGPGLGTAPLSWLRSERVLPACRLIEAGGLGPEVIARTSGLGGTADLRAQTGTSPSAYRERFGPRPSTGAEP